MKKSKDGKSPSPKFSGSNGEPEVVHRSRQMLAENLVQIRTAKKITTAEIENLAGLCRGEVESFERCAKAARLDDLERLATALDIPLWELLRSHD